jgi:CubicO group peptidase (beta-lactamase class C family)
MRRALVPCTLVLLLAPAAQAVTVARTLPSEAVQAAARYSKDRAELSLVVYQHGRVLLEEYPAGDAKTGQFVASVVKSLWGLAAAAAVQDGLLSFDEPVAATFPEWKADPRKSRIKVRDLLTMTSGLDPGYDPLYMVDPDDAYQVALSLPAVNEPGELFVYGPANMEVFGALMEKKLARRGLSPLRYLEKRVLEPVGAGYTAWTRDRVGHAMMSSGASMTARQLLAVGQLMAKHGIWRGRHLLAADKLAALFKGTEANPAYGMTFWLNSNAAKPEAIEVDIEKTLSLGVDYDGWRAACVSKAAPADLMVMVGSWNQRIYVSPSLDLVVVRQGGGTEFSDAEFLARLLK